MFGRLYRALKFGIVADPWPPPRQTTWGDLLIHQTVDKQVRTMGDEQEGVESSEVSKSPKRTGNNAPFGYVFFRTSPQQSITIRDVLQNHVECILLFHHYRE